MRRYCSVIRVRPESLDAYKRYHTTLWPEVLDMIRTSTIRKYSIFLKDDLLFGYFRVPQRRLCGGHGKDGSGSENTGVVGSDDAHAKATRHARTRRVVGQHGGGLSLQRIDRR